MQSKYNRKIIMYIELVYNMKFFKKNFNGMRPQLCIYVVFL